MDRFCCGTVDTEFFHDFLNRDRFPVDGEGGLGSATYFGRTTSVKAELILDSYYVFYLDHWAALLKMYPV